MTDTQAGILRLERSIGGLRRLRLGGTDSLA